MAVVRVVDVVVVAGREKVATAASDCSCFCCFRRDRRRAADAVVAPAAVAAVYRQLRSRPSLSTRGRTQGDVILVLALFCNYSNP